MILIKIEVKLSWSNMKTIYIIRIILYYISVVDQNFVNILLVEITQFKNAV